MGRTDAALNEGRLNQSERQQKGFFGMKIPFLSWAEVTAEMMNMMNVKMIKK